ncbi:MAG: CopD family protein [Thermoleophilia bacterium]|nr:CopD family protein [Thermoleophilia bacterium]
MYTALVAVHVLAAAVWVGGTVALVATAVPVLRRFPREQRADGMRWLGRRWRPLGWGALLLLAASGCWLAFGYWNAGDPDFIFGSGEGRLVLAKLALLLSLVVSAAVHDFVLGPRLNAQVRAGLPQTLRNPMRAVGWWSFAVTLALPVLGVVLSR